MKLLYEAQYEFEKALINIDRVSSKRIFEDLINGMNNKDDIMEAIDKVIITSIRHIGDGWEKGSISLAQVYMSGKICDELISILLPSMDTCIEVKAKMAICCFEDYHIIGKRIVSAIVKANGYKLIDYDCGVKIDKLVDNIIKDKIEILMISTLMVSSALKIKKLKSELDALNIDVKIIVGGAPFLFDTGLWNKVGAYAMGKNATDIIDILGNLTGR